MRERKSLVVKTPIARIEPKGCGCGYPLRQFP